MIYYIITNDTTPATPEQYKELFAELQGIGYVLATGKRLSRRPKSYEEEKAAAIAEAVEWQSTTAQQPMSWQEAAEWDNHFERLGRRYGLLREFRENGII